MASRNDQDIALAMEIAWKAELEMIAIVEVDWGMSGCEDARPWVIAARLPDWHYLHHRQDIIRKQGRPRWEVPPPYLQGTKTFDDRWFVLQDRMHQQEEYFLDWLYERGGIDREAAEREYMSAWLAYTDSAWDLIREKRKRYSEERHHQWLEAKEKGHDPTVPEELFREIDAAD